MYFKNIPIFTDVRKNGKIVDSGTIHQREMRVLLSSGVGLVRSLDNNVCQFVDTI